MIGLGAGARSYTRTLHYGLPYGVRRPSVNAIIHDFMEQNNYAMADHGIGLNQNEQRRRYAIKTILRSAGLNRQAYKRRFGADALDDFPEFITWCDKGWLEAEKECLRLTRAGIELSDILGPSLYSEAIRKRINEFPWEMA